MRKTLSILEERVQESWRFASGKLLKKKLDVNHARLISCFIYLETSDCILAFCVGDHQLVGQPDDGKYYV
jgi:hypothetical protein